VGVKQPEERYALGLEGGFVERTRALEEPISPELVLVDEDLAVRARKASPDPPWVLPAVAEAQQHVVTPAVTVEERPAPEVAPPPARPSFSRHLRATAVFGVALVGLVTVVSLTLELMPGSAKPTLATRRAEPAAPAPSKQSTSAQPAKRPRVQESAKPKAAAKTRSKPKRTRRPRSRPPAASAPTRAAKPRARAAVKVRRVFSWHLYPGAVYYQLHLQRGSKTIYEQRTLEPTASIRLTLEPGTYRTVVRPAIPSDAGIILGPAIMNKIVRV
jgi:hypothetical protein